MIDEMTDRFWRLRDVLDVVGISRSALYRRMADGEFPLPKKLGSGRAIRWSRAEVEAWMASQPAANLGPLE